MDEVLKLLGNSSTLSGATVTSLVVAILLLGSRGVWYYGSTHRDVIKDRDDWKGIAISATATVKDQAAQIEKLTEVTETLSKAISPRRR